MSKLIKLFSHLALALLLTALTQIGGVIYLLVFLIGRRRSFISKLLIFAVFYAGASYLASYIAPKFGRVALPCHLERITKYQSNYKMASPLYCALNRHYVTRKTKRLVEQLSDHIANKYPKTQTLVLDANFPFFNGFPLLPHLSHHDGKKVDLAFYYQNFAGTYQRGEMRSPIGYWAFEQPISGTSLPCRKKSTGLNMRWNMELLQGLFPNLELEPKRTAEALRWLIDKGPAFSFEKLFIEPHLADRLGVRHRLIRFQGCCAARHDDHIHIQTR